MEALQYVTDDNFAANVLTVKDIPIMVIFSAPWCGQCKMMAPQIETAAEIISREYAAKICKYEAPVDTIGTITTMFNINALPTIMIFRDGETMYKSNGVVSANRMIELIKPFIKEY